MSFDNLLGYFQGASDFDFTDFILLHSNLEDYYHCCSVVITQWQILACPRSDDWAELRGQLGLSLAERQPSNLQLLPYYFVDYSQIVFDYAIVDFTPQLARLETYLLDFDFRFAHHGRIARAARWACSCLATLATSPT